MTLAWVLGAGGLLGSALCRVLKANGSTLFTPKNKFAWTDPSALPAQIESAVREFAAEVPAWGKWEIYWAAGLGTMSSPEEALVPETRALAQLLDLVRTNLELVATNGAIGFASSAGAIYGMSSEEVITEASPPAPNSAYGREKLRQETLLREFCSANPRVAVLLARISTLYGVGQATGKPQGLLTHIARNIIRNKPVGIFVPIDTIRDYIAADDAAADMVDTMQEISARPALLVKIVASGQPVTIAEIISIFRRIARRPPRITTSASKSSALYQRRVQFRSVVGDGRRRRSPRSLVVGIAQLFSAECFFYANPGRRYVGERHSAD